MLALIVVTYDKICAAHTYNRLNNSINNQFLTDYLYNSLDKEIYFIHLQPVLINTHYHETFFTFNVERIGS